MNIMIIFVIFVHSYCMEIRAIRGMVLLSYWNACMGMGCHPDSVAEIPQGQLME